MTCGACMSMSHLLLISSKGLILFFVSTNIASTALTIPVNKGIDKFSTRETKDGKDSANITNKIKIDERRSNVVCKVVTESKD